MSGRPTKKTPRKRARSDMRKEYGFSGGVRGKYAKRFARGSNVVVLDPDLAGEFKSPKAVNRALRAYLAEAKRKKRGAGGAS